MDSRKWWLRCIMMVGLVILAGGLSGCNSNSSSSTNTDALRIYEMIAGKGSFTTASGDATGTKFQLSLSNVPGSVLYFTDRPVNEAGYDTVDNVMNTIWPRVYGTVAPNVILKATTANQGSIELFCMLEKPVYSAATGQLSFTLTHLNGNQQPVHNLAVTDVKIIILNNATTARTEWSQLMTGDTGTFEPAATADTYTFRIQQAAGAVVSYTNAPDRQSVTIPVKEFMQTWQSRFGSTPPNVSIAYDAQNSLTGGVQIVTLTNPVYDEKSGNISFTAKRLYGTTPIGAGGLRVAGVSLFIDGAEAGLDPDKTRTVWKTALDKDGNASITVTTQPADGGNPAPVSIMLKGIAYSPTPLGFIMKYDWHFGDLFWDTQDTENVLDNEKIWKRDLDAIRATGANTIRVYNMMAHYHADGVPKYDKTFTHKKFLDACWNKGNNPLYVLVGIAMGDEIWHQELNGMASSKQWVDFWETTLRDTVNQLKDHPAVIGFIFNNEKDRDLDINGRYRDFWWGQVKSYSQTVKSLASGKLVGMALNDLPSLWDDDGTRTLAAANGTSLDFWGINAYQNTQAGFSNSLNPYLPSVMGAAAKPVLITEYGFPATSRSVNSVCQDAATTTAVQQDPAAICEDARSRQKVASTLDNMLPYIFNNKQVIGLYYFEWSDEWWNQSSWDYIRKPENIPDKGVSPNELGNYWTWYGGPYTGGFPNYYWDQMGFGLNSIAYDPKRDPTKSWYTANAWEHAANVDVDILTPRTEIINSLKKGFSGAKAR